VAKDEIEAYKWWLLAAAQGNDDAKYNTTIVENKMTREQIAEGQRLAREFKPRKLPSEGSDARLPP
jgi:TPR repeat protein